MILIRVKNSPRLVASAYTVPSYSDMDIVKISENQQYDDVYLRLGILALFQKFLILEQTLVQLEVAL